jgi:hypothetical protein
MLGLLATICAQACSRRGPSSSSGRTRWCCPPTSTDTSSVYAAVTEDGARVLQHARTVYIRLLTETLGAHLDDAALDELAAGMAKLRSGLAEAGGGC